MKFGHDLQQLQASYGQEYRFLPYKRLKKVVKAQTAGERRALQVEAYAQKFEEDTFFQLLDAELRQINSEFARHTLRLLQRHGWRHTLARLLACTGSPSTLEEREALAQAARQCREYAAANATALRKILKKHDKQCGSDAGRRFLQACWAGSDLARGSILHSPLLTELEVLARGAACEQACTSCSPAADSFSSCDSKAAACTASAQQAPAPHGGAGSGVQEEDLKCGICLDVLYKPLGLSCGHRFCGPCLMEAYGTSDILAPPHYILVRLAHTRAVCPQCRQQGVGKDAQKLRELGNAAKEHFPEDWAARRKEEKARRKELEQQLLVFFP